MRFMMLVIPKVYEPAGADFVPTAELVAKMTKYNESLTKAGVLLGSRSDLTNIPRRLDVLVSWSWGLRVDSDLLQTST